MRFARADLAQFLFTALRWLMLAPAAISAWMATVVLGMLLMEPLERLACTEAFAFAGACGDHVRKQALITYLFVGLSALAVETGVVLVAPAGRRACLWLAFLIGCATAYYAIAWSIDQSMTGSDFSYAHTAAACGLVGALLYDRVLTYLPAG
ncbi:MAG TPA: hypothetical protein VGN52_20990 [Burkholderiales bacterium]